MLYGHLQINAANRDTVASKINLTGFDHTEELYAFLGKENSIHIKRSLPSQTSLLSNFGQYDNSMFWQMTTATSLELTYDRRSTKPLYNQWYKMLGPVSLSPFDQFQIQYDCFQGKLMLDFMRLYDNN